MKKIYNQPIVEATNIYASAAVLAGSFGSDPTFQGDPISGDGPQGDAR